MSLTKSTMPGKLVRWTLAIAVFALTAALASVAFAADEAPQTSVSDIIQQLANSPVYEAECTALCHANIANTKNYASSINFSHAYHILMQCSDCHTRFPHRQTGTERPTMKGCFNCHGVRHGPKGIIATDVCEKCHKTPRWQQSCPYSSQPQWSTTGHVKMGNDNLNTDCMMCHKPNECVDCHDAKGVKWEPANGWDYDPGESSGPKAGCLTCHANATMLKSIGGGTQSFQVSGLEFTAHSELTCQQCHPDYRYDDKPGATKLWNVNAGLQCGTCHETLDRPDLTAPVPEYDASKHADEINKGNYESATCGSCHGGHYIYRLDTEEASAAMHASAYRTCARCKQHGDEYTTYNDYYHGRAYKKGAPDAPACWDCHEAHEVLPKSDPKSSVYPTNLGTTCGQEGCHKGSTEKFGADAGQLIHQKVTAQEQNPVLQFISNIQGMIGGDNSQ